VALFSMGIVVASGVVGRFIYVRVHRGLNGEMTSLAELRQRAGLVESRGAVAAALRARGRGRAAGLRAARSGPTPVAL
jgi:hypothetical protein